MNTLCSGLVLLFLAIGVSAQTSTAPPDVTVLQKKWHMDVRNRALEQDPFAANKDRLREESQQKTVAQQNEGRLKQGEPTLPPPNSRPTFNNSPIGITTTYIYEIKVKNDGPKEIRRIVWEYAFSEPDTLSEAGRRRFATKVRIKAGASKTVVGRSRSSPTGTLDARKAGIKPSEQYAERIVIRRLEYADGSVWPAVAK